MIFELPKLKYEYGALEPWIDAKTMEIHYTKHHQAYLDKLNKAVEGTELDNKEINEILSDIENIPGNIRNAVVNNGGGYANHSLFWQIMSPNGGALPNNSLIKAINAKWKSFNNFKQDFSNASLGLFGSGCAAHSGCKKYSLSDRFHRRRRRADGRSGLADPPRGRAVCDPGTGRSSGGGDL